MSETTRVCPVISFDEKSELEKKYRELLFNDLLNGQTHFSAGPYEAHIQFSNFCNMSCIMCWNGNNPPTQKMDPELLDRIGEQVGPHLSIVTPYSGSEPLVLTWDQTREMSEKYGIQLCVTTNVQFLDEAKFFELKDITETLILSIDSHIPKVFEKIRPGANTKKVFANLATTAKLCLEHNLECIVNVVLMTQNAPMLTDTLEYFAGLGIQNVNIIQLLDVNGESSIHDPLIHFSEEYIAWIKRESIATSKANRLRLIWSVAGYEEFDFRQPGFVPIKPRKLWNDVWDERMKRLFPRFCRNAYGRLRIDNEGDIAPCCYATQGELSLGNLFNQDFAEIWNSVEAQDLRRGMFSGDVPALCKSCRYHDLVDPFFTLPFIESEESEFGSRYGLLEETAIASLEIVAPDHGARTTDVPDLVICEPNMSVEKYVVALGLGGETDEVHREEVVAAKNDDGTISLAISPEIWQRLKPNVGYWWMVWAIPTVKSHMPVRLEKTRCLIRHLELVRLEGSQLRYSDQGFVPVTDLGGTKRAGWQDPNHLPARPVAAFHGRAKKAKPKIESSQLVSLEGPKGVTDKPRGILSRVFGSSEVQSAEAVESAEIENAYLDYISQLTDGIKVCGWLLLKNGSADQIEIHGPDDHVVVCAVTQRLDISQANPKYESAIDAGFEATLVDEKFWRGDRYQFAIVAKQNGQTVFRCQVTCGTGDGETAHCIRDGVLNI